MAIEIREIETKDELKKFILFVRKIYRNDKNFVHPLFFDVSTKLDKRKNPYFEHAKAKYFIAERNREMVGRLTAQIDRHYFEHWGAKVGHFGFFECIDDQEVANALFDRACEWLRQEGQEKIQGPYNLTINDECGLLIDGFDLPPMILMTYNPPYYQKLIENYGFKKAMDLLAYRMDSTQEPPEDVVRFAEMLKKKHQITIRNMSHRNFDRELDKFVEIYNSAWEKNWGMVPLTEKEIRMHKPELWLLARFFPELNFFAEVEGKPVGMSITLPNFNEVLIKLNGRLLTPGIFRFFTHKFESCRVFALGVKPDYRRLGIGAVFYVETLFTARRLGYKWGEMSWILENNQEMNRAIQHMGGKVYKSYRIYEKEL